MEPQNYTKRLKAEIHNDHFQNFKRYNVPKAQLIIADIPYNIGKNAYGSSPQWYKDGDNANGESELANSEFFDTDKDFRPSEFMHFCSKMLRKEPTRPKTAKQGERIKSTAPCMIVFCAFEQQFRLIELAKRHGLNNYINLVFRKNFSGQVLKANMRVVGNCEYALIFYRDKLPKFNNKDKDGNNRMVMNCMNWESDGKSVEKIHPTQKPVSLIKKLIKTFTDPGDVVIDPCCGSGSTLVAALELKRPSYGFEIKKGFHADAVKRVEKIRQREEDIDQYGFARREITKTSQPILF